MLNYFFIWFIILVCGSFSYFAAVLLLLLKPEPLSDLVLGHGFIVARAWVLLLLLVEDLNSLHTGFDFLNFGKLELGLGINGTGKQL